MATVTKSIEYNFLFVLDVTGDEFHVSGDDLSNIGYTIEYQSDSLAKISDHNGFKLVPFAPIKFESFLSSNEEQSNDLDLKL